MLWLPQGFQPSRAALDASGGGSTLKVNLISFWELEEASGTRADAHGSNTLTDNNTVTQAAGKVGNAAQFTAANSEFLSHASNASLQTGAIDYSLAAWVYLDAVAADITIASKLALAAGQGEYKLSFETGARRLTLAVFDNGLSADAVSTANSSVNATATWFFVVAVVDQSNSLIKISLDGGTFTTAAITLAYVAGTADFNMGAYRSAAEFWDGRIDQFGFWKKALTQSEVTQLYNSGSGLSYAAM